ncbi:MAG: hypothetical protein ACYTEP_10545, partial [Planctomycetota bacterium]
MMKALPLLAFGLAAPLAAQSNATSTLMSYGDELGGSASLVMADLTPNTPVLLIPSLFNTGSAFLTGITGDANDQLAVGIDLASNGTLFSGLSDTNGDFTLNLALPPSGGLLDTSVYWQGWTDSG